MRQSRNVPTDIAHATSVSFFILAKSYKTQKFNVSIPFVTSLLYVHL